MLFPASTYHISVRCRDVVILLRRGLPSSALSQHSHTSTATCPTRPCCVPGTSRTHTEPRVTDTSDAQYSISRAYAPSASTDAPSLADVEAIRWEPLHPSAVDLVQRCCHDLCISYLCGLLFPLGWLLLGRLCSIHRLRQQG